MSNPFKKIVDNSKETAKKWEDTQEQPALSTVACPQCGAPRPVNTNIGNCAYCGYKFMNVEVRIDRKPKN